MKKQLKILLIATSLFTCLSGCNVGQEYTVRQIPVFGYDTNHMIDVKCRYYDDIKELPYIDINTYYKLLLDKEVKITPLSTNKYEIQTFNGSATIDVENDVLYSEDYNEFINTTIFRSGNSRNGYYDGAPYLKMGEYTSTSETTPKTIDFKKYKIDFKYDAGKIWAPLITFSDMFKGVTMIQSFYNGEEIYLFDSNHSVNQTSIFYQSNYMDSVGKTFFKEGKRDPKLAELSYLELCFVMDNYFGFPGRSPIEELSKEHGFDYALENYSDGSRLVKEYLVSDDVNKYLAGMILLSDLLEDGGHTVTKMAPIVLMYSESFSSYGDKNKIMEYTRNPAYVPVAPVEIYPLEEYENALNEMDANKTFRSKGDTFVYKFDSFDIDYAGWDDYYSGKTEELPTDAVGNFHRGIDLAKQDPNIKNFLIDLSVNGGGFGDVVIYIMKILANKPTMYFYDHIDKRNIAQNYLCDVNLDGKFDELDNVPIADFNFGIVTSNQSFSCGNLLPALAQDSGLPILGYNAGGGACAVLDNCSMEGIYYRVSSFLHFTDQNYNSIDEGVIVDYDLIHLDKTPNFNNLYDLDLLSQKMNEFYSE